MVAWGRQGRLVVWKGVFGGLLGLTIGCQTPPAGVTACETDGSATTRSALFVHQVAEDSAAELVTHPVRCGASLAIESAQYLRAITEGVLGKRLALRWFARPGLLPPDRAGPEPALLSLDAVPAAKSDLRPAHVQLYTDGRAALEALKNLIDAATCRIDVMMFTWGSDPVGWALAEHLAAKAGPQLKVRVLVDACGNLIYGQPGEASAAEVNRAVCWLSRQPYVEVLRTRDPCGRFDHRKLVLVDGQVAFSGGRNFTERSFVERHDLSYTLAGPLVGEVSELFEESWQDQGGAPAAPAGPTLTQGTPAANAWGRVVATQPLRHDFACSVYRAVDRARHHITIENPYFSDSTMLVKLACAQRRGVDVRVVLTLNTDEATSQRANRVTANRLLRAGVRVYLYPAPMHTKAIGVDSCWAYVGTGNFDPLSMRKDRELGVTLEAGPVPLELEETLLRADCRPDWELKKPLPLSPRDLLDELLLSLI